MTHRGLIRNRNPLRGRPRLGNRSRRPYVYQGPCHLSQEENLAFLYLSFPSLHFARNTVPALHRLSPLSFSLLVVPPTLLNLRLRNISRNIDPYIFQLLSSNFGFVRNRSILCNFRLPMSLTCGRTCVRLVLPLLTSLLTFSSIYFASLASFYLGAILRRNDYVAIVFSSLAKFDTFVLLEVIRASSSDFYDTTISAHEA